jgi:hypothetical protein
MQDTHPPNFAGYIRCRKQRAERNRGTRRRFTVGRAISERERPDGVQTGEVNVLPSGQSAMSLAGKQFGVDPSRSTLTARVALGPVDGGRYGLAVELEVSIPGVEREVAEKILKRAHEVCPYNNATRRNIEVSLKVV